MRIKCIMSFSASHQHGLEARPNVFLPSAFQQDNIWRYLFFDYLFQHFVLFVPPYCFSIHRPYPIPLYCVFQQPLGDEGYDR